MLNSFGKRVEKNHFYRRAKLFFKRVAGKELWLHREVNVETAPHGDWRVDPKDMGSNSVVYSLGIGHNIEFDIGLIEQFGCEIHAFDPTPFTLQWLSTQSPPAGFHFHPWAISGHDGLLTLYPRVKKDGTMSKTMYTQVPEESSRGHGLNVPVLTIASAMDRLGHRHIDLLKMDIEGAEYEVIDTLPAPPGQLLVEFHHRFPGIGIQKTVRAIDRLRKEAYRIMAVSESGSEVSFLRMPCSPPD